MKYLQHVATTFSAWITYDWTRLQNGTAAGPYLVIAHMLFNSVRFSDEGALQDNSAFLVPLVLLCGEFIDPSQLGVTVFARYIPHHMAPCEHHPVLHLTDKNKGFDQSDSFKLAQENLIYLPEVEVYHSVE